MVEQVWFNNNYALLGVLRGESNINKTGVVFLPGLGQTKAGIYFLFTKIAMELEKDFVTLQFDYGGFGDSEGELCECDLQQLMLDSTEAIKLLVEEKNCEEIILIGMGIGNIIAAKCAIHIPVVKDIVLLSPYKKRLKDYVEFSDIIKKIENSPDVLDTSELGDWEKEEFLNEYFIMLGAGLHRSKGLLIQKKLLLELSEIDIEGLLLKSKKKIMLIQAKGSKRIIFHTGMNNLLLEKSDEKLQSPDDREIIIREISLWIKKGRKEKV